MASRKTKEPRNGGSLCVGMGQCRSVNSIVVCTTLLYTFKLRVLVEFTIGTPLEYLSDLTAINKVIIVIGDFDFLCVFGVWYPEEFQMP